MANATVKGGLFAQYSATLSQQWPYHSTRRRARQALSKYSNFALREKMETLNGTAAGSAASKALSRVEANVELGGKRTIESHTFISANTAAGDVTEINDTVLSLSSKTYDGTPVANLDGNPLGTR